VLAFCIIVFPVLTGFAASQVVENGQQLSEQTISQMTSEFEK